MRGKLHVVATEGRYTLLRFRDEECRNRFVLLEDGRRISSDCEGDEFLKRLRAVSDAWECWVGHEMEKNG
jgi:hypothetical protein